MSNYSGTLLKTSLLGALSLLLSMPLQAQTLATQGLRLDKVVLVMRHGIRPATDTAALQAWSAKTWPAFPVTDGQLTHHGYAATVIVGKWERQYLDRLGLFTAGTCPDTRQTYLFSSPVKRTQATSKALLEGMFPGCQVAVHHGAANKDRLFHGGENGLSATDPERARTEILAAMGGSPAAAEARYGDAVRTMQNLVGVPAKCPANKGTKGCAFSDIPWSLKTGKSDIKLSGPLSVGAAMSETFRMQYAEGLPLDKVAFGAGRTAADVARLMELRSAKYALGNHLPYIAQRGASQLLQQILLGLDTGDKPLLGGPPAVKWLAYVGHDSNIAQLRTLMGFDWKIAEYPENDAAPGGTLLFERWVDDHTGARFVSLAYVAQSMDQLRDLTPLDADVEPFRVQFPGLAGEKSGPMMPLEDFEKVMAERIDKQATEPQVYAR
jgi:4-phytase/acid phosphatase